MRKLISEDRKALDYGSDGVRRYTQQRIADRNAQRLAEKALSGVAKQKPYRGKPVVSEK